MCVSVCSNTKRIVEKISARINISKKLKWWNRFSDVIFFFSFFLPNTYLYSALMKVAWWVVNCWYIGILLSVLSFTFSGFPTVTALTRAIADSVALSYHILSHYIAICHYIMICCFILVFAIGSNSVWDLGGEAKALL